MHIGVLHHHRALEAWQDGGLCRRATATHAPDIGNSDSAFIFRCFLSYLAELPAAEAAGLQPLAAAMVATLSALARPYRPEAEAGAEEVSERLPPPSSLNLAASDGKVLALCRFRLEGDEQVPPPVWYSLRGGTLRVSSTPLADEGSWEELGAGTLLTFGRGAVRPRVQPLAPLLSSAAAVLASPPACLQLCRPTATGASPTTGAIAGKAAWASVVSLAETRLRQVVGSALAGGGGGGGDGAPGGAAAMSAAKRVSALKKAALAEVKRRLQSEGTAADPNQIVEEAAASLREACAKEVGWVPAAST